MSHPSGDAAEAKQEVTHRASYRLELGEWKATCRVCGWEVRHPVRRQAATVFRRHIVAARNGHLPNEDIDLRDVVIKPTVSLVVPPLSSN